VDPKNDYRTAKYMLEKRIKENASDEEIQRATQKVNDAWAALKKITTVNRRASSG
jgi:F0F1-type ATP synthase epsilon subunit